MIRNSHLAHGTIAVIGVVFHVALTQADLIEYGDFAGDTVNFFDVTESSLHNGPLFGPPIVDGDSLDFHADLFSSMSINGGLNFVNGRISLFVEAAEGHMIDAITVSEFGAFFDFGPESLSRVNAVAFVQINDDLYDSVFTFSNLGDGFGEWSDSLTIEFPATDRVRFVMDNQLFTFADYPGVAFIDKMGIRISVSSIPEAGKIPMLMVMAIFVGLAGQRSVGRLPWLAG